MRIGIVGAGGAGGYFAGRWSEAGLDVTLVARGGHLAAMREHGLKVMSPLGDMVARPALVDSGAALAGMDLVIYATKTWQLPKALEETRDHVSPGALVLGLQNGVESPEVLATSLPQACVLGATCRIISFIDSPGVIRHVGADPTIDFGTWDRAPSRDLDELSATLAVEGKVTVNHAPDIRFEVWKKFLFFAPLSGIGAMHDLTIGEVRSDPELRGQLEAAMQEVAALATAAGVTLGADDVAGALAFVDVQPAQGTSSLQRDVAAGRPNEFASLSAHVVNLGKALGVPTPTHAKIVEQVEKRMADE